MLTSQRTEDTSGVLSASGVPGTPSNLPRPTSRPGTGTKGTSRISENITYQSSRTVKKTHLPAGVLRKISVAVLVDQELTWQKDKTGFRRVLIPPSPEKLKVIHDLVAGVTGFSADRGDQLVVESQPFENTLLIEPPPAPPVGSPAAPRGPSRVLQLDRKTLIVAGTALAALIVIGFTLAMVFRRSRKSRKAQVTGPTELPAPSESAEQAKKELAEADALTKEAEAKAKSSLKVLTPVITKTAEIMAKHLREKISQEPEVSAQVLRTWIRDEEL
jgi:flagellar M-ring protein FliF